MFAIGSNLREARERRGIPFSRIEEVTRIRSRHLKALEDERFESLPGRAYTRAFLREYADFLGLEGQEFVDEFDARFPVAEEPPIAPRGLPRPTGFPPYVRAAVVAVVLALFAAWQLSARDEEPTSVPAHAPSLPPPAIAQPPPPRHLPPPPAPAVAKLVLRADRGPCWLGVHVGSRDGRLLWEGMLEPGQSIRFSGRRLWIRVGAPWNLEATLAGRPLRLPDRVANIVVTRRGLRPE